MAVVLIVFLTLMTQCLAQFDVSKCGQSVNCFRHPIGCTTKCDAVATYQYNKSKGTVLFQLWTSSSHKWVAFAQKPLDDNPAFMVDLRGQYCVQSTKVSFGNFNGNSITRNTSPTWVPTVSGVKLLSTNSNGFLCFFERPLLSTDDNLYSLNGKMFATIAFGDSLDNEIPSYHGHGSYRISNVALDFTKGSSTTQTTTTTLPETTVHHVETTTIPRHLDNEKLEKFNVSKCGQSVNCFRHPTGCTTKCDAVATYQYNKSNGKVLFQLWTSSSHKWVAFAQKPLDDNPAFMVDLRGQYCVRSTKVSFGNFNGNSITRNTSPTWVPTVQGVKLLSSNEHGFLCSFERPANASVESKDDLYDLDEKLFAVIAFGGNLQDDKIPLYHGPGSYTRSSTVIDFIKTTRTASLTTTVKPFTQTVKPASRNQLDLSKCDVAYNCFRHPIGCKTNCDAIATFQYKPINEHVFFQLWASPRYKWVGFGQKVNNANENFMFKLRGQYCVKTTLRPLFGSFNGDRLVNPSTPQWKSEVNGVVFLNSTIKPDGSLLCSFKRPLNVTASNSGDLYDLNQRLSAALAFGPKLINDEFPGYHQPTGYSVSSTSLNFMQIQKVHANNSPSTLKKAHGVLMILAWVLFVTCGIFMARYMKPILSIKVVDKDAWYRCHQLFMSLALISMISGFVVILKEMKGWSKHPTLHHWFGLAAIILGGIQPVLAAFRCDPEHEKRFIFTWIHRLVGMSAWTIAAVAIVFGLKLLSIGYMTLLVFLGLIVAIFAILDFLNYCLIKQREYIPVQRDIPLKNINDSKQMKADGYAEQMRKPNQYNWIFNVAMTLVMVLSVVVTLFYLRRIILL